MAKPPPWTTWFHEDFLQGCALANLDAAEIGVYAIILNLMAARGGPIEDDRRWIAGRSGCTSTRQCSAIIQRLLDTGKLISRHGMLGNSKMLGVIQQRDLKSNQARRAALARWHGDDLELPLDEPNGDLSGALSAPKNPDNSDLRHPVKSKKPRKTAKTDDADASPPVRAQDSETQKDNLTHPIPKKVEEAAGSGPGELKPGDLDDADLVELHARVCEAAGYRTVSPNSIAASMDEVKRWREQGHDFATVVIPAIRAVVAHSQPSDRTRTLGRFRHAIAREAAKSVHAKASGRNHVPSATPLLAPKDEDPQFQKLRTILLERLGPTVFTSYVNPIRFEAVDDAMNGSRPVRVVGQGNNRRLLDDDRTSIVRNAVRSLGFTDVW